MSGGFPPLLRLRNLSFTYRHGRRRALDGVDLDLDAGCWRLLMGPTGAGKSTLVRCLNRSIPLFYPGELSGQLLVSGRDVSACRVAEMARHVGVVFQEFESQIFSTTCLMEVAFAMENRCLPRALIRSRASELLAQVGLAGFEERDPATLSGGEKQRLVIAAVLALQAPILVLDEPASDLDPGGREQVYGLFSNPQTPGAGSASVLLVEHDLEGVPAWAGGTLLVDGKVRRSFNGASAVTMVELAETLAAAGVRAPPIASLAAVLNRTQAARRVPPFRLAALDPLSLHTALQEGGWKLRTTSRTSPISPSDMGREILRCEGLTYAYPTDGGRRAALDRVDLSIRQGEMVALIGANGSGKTTLARHLNGLLSPTSGRVLYEGEEVARIPARRRAKEIGFVFQNPDHQIFAPTVDEEIAFGPINLGRAPSEARRSATAALEAVGLAGRGSEDPFTMTKGERQRVALASVLACDPSVVIMDEPTTGLDLGQQKSVMGLLERLNTRGHTILIITHALWLVTDPIRRVLVMVKGRLAADGSPASLMTDARVMEEAGLRMPDLARFAGLWEAPLLSLEGWVAALSPPESRLRF